MSIACPLRVRIYASALLLWIVAACSGSAPEGAWQKEGALREATREVNADQIRAANALSLGNPQTIEDAGSPHTRALVCRDAIDSVITRLQEAGLASEPQLALLAEARGIYDGRLQAAGSSMEPRAAGLEGDPNTGSAADSASVFSSKAQLALACLQQLQ